MPLTTRLVKKEEVAAGTMAFYFEKPAGFEYKSGQHIDLELINPPETDAEGNIRTFSLITAPHEENIGIATRMRDTAFKRVLKILPEGTGLNLKGPLGSMTLHNDTTKPAVILAGGIGITPFYSMIKYATHAKLPHKIFLFYSNRGPEDAAFLNELADLAKQNVNFSFIATMTNMEKSSRPWNGERGYITRELITKYVPDIIHGIGYLAGPPAMTAAMHKLLNESGLNDDFVRMEEFSGY